MPLPGNSRRHRRAEGAQSAGHALAAAGFDLRAGNQRLGLIVERAQKLALPPVPDAGPDGANIGDRQHQQQLQPLGVPDNAGKVANGLRIADIARLRVSAHHEMVLDQPHHLVDLVSRQAEPFRDTPRHASADDGMVFRAALADVVQEGREIQRAAIDDGLEDAMRERMDLVRLAALDLGDNADGADQMLIQREVMIHVELHHRHDAPEIGDEPAEHAGLVHPPQRRLDVAAGQQVEKNAVGLGIGPQAVVDQPQRLPQEADGIRMVERARFLGRGEEANEVHRIALEDIGIGDVHPAVVDAEVGRAANAATRAPAHGIEHRRDGRRRLQLLDLERRAQHSGQIADIFRDQEEVLHEPLDRLQAAALPGISEPLGQTTAERRMSAAPRPCR